MIATAVKYSGASTNKCPMGSIRGLSGLSGQNNDYDTPSHANFDTDIAVLRPAACS